MKRFILFQLSLLFYVFCSADIVVIPSQTTGKIKPMHAVNNGPVRIRSDQSRGNFPTYKAAQIPYARTHDASFFSAYGGEHSVDITGIFPDFSKDANDPASYDFVLTDEYLETIQDAGTKVFYRLGQRIEHEKKKYGILPPADFQKWAVICEHIIRHYTEGWANGYKWDIQYWEIWNEPDLDAGEAWKTNPRTWGGSEEQFFELFQITANHLNKCFPNLKIGGPAICGDEEWGDRFLAYMSKHNVQMDFFSWHIYSNRPNHMSEKADRIRKMMDKYGYNKAESILNEWNYVEGWSKEFPYTAKTISEMKGTAFLAAVMSACQDKPVDMLMYYDARPSTVFNGLWDFYTYAPTRGYYGIYAWSKLVEYGQQIKVNSDYKDLYVTAAKDNSGKIAIFITRYSGDNNVCASEKYKVKIENISVKKAIAHLTDDNHIYTEIPVNIKDGEMEIQLEPNAFIMIEL